VPPKVIFVLLFCSALAAQQPATKYGITVRYGADFNGHSWKQEPKLTQQEIGTDIPEGVAPLRSVLQLKGRLPGRADDNTIEVTPLADRSRRDFAKAYPGLNSSAVALRALLARSQLPGMKALEKPIRVPQPHPRTQDRLQLSQKDALSQPRKHRDETIRAATAPRHLRS